MDNRNELKPIVINPTEEEQERIGKAVSSFWRGMFKMGKHRLTEWIEEYCKGEDDEQSSTD